jgi:hypothetical protein
MSRTKTQNDDLDKEDIIKDDAVIMSERIIPRDPIETSEKSFQEEQQTGRRNTQNWP